MILENTRQRIVTEDDLLRVPRPVRRYLAFTGVVGKPWVDTVHLKYSGKFRLGADKPWMPISVSQSYTVDPPGFLWKATFKIAGLPLMFADDTYRNGHGHMLGKILGLFTVVDGQGEAIDQGTMVRYLQEMTWFPCAYLSEYITWQAVDDHAADVTFTDSGKSVTARMYFDDAGRLLTFIAPRYGEFGGQYAMRTWTAPITEYGSFAGLNLPSAGQRVWQLPDSDLTYIHVRVTEIEYNQPMGG